MFDIVDANILSVVVTILLLLFATMTLIHEGAASYYKMLVPFALVLAACVVVSKQSAPASKGPQAQ